MRVSSYKRLLVITTITSMTLMTTVFAAGVDDIGKTTDPYVVKSYVNTKIQEKSSEIQALKTRLDTLEQRLQNLEAKAGGSTGTTPPPSTTTPPPSTTTPATKTVGIINGSYVNSRSSSSLSSSIVKVLTKGTQVEVIEKVTDSGKEWYKVKLTDSKIAYVSATYLTVSQTPSSGTTTTQPVTTKMVYASGSSVNVRQTASAYSTKLGTLTKTSGAVLVKDGYWRQIKLSNGTIAYVSSEYTVVK